MRKDWFQQLGLFDEGMREWGGAWLSVAERGWAWLLVVMIAMCHVSIAHFFRSSLPDFFHSWITHHWLIMLLLKEYRSVCVWQHVALWPRSFAILLAAEVTTWSWPWRHVLTDSKHWKSAHSRGFTLTNSLLFNASFSDRTHFPRTGLALWWSHWDSSLLSSWTSFPGSQSQANA